MQDLDRTWQGLKVVRQKAQKGLAAKLRDELTLLQQMQDQATAHSNAAIESAVQHTGYGRVAGAVTQYEDKYLMGLQDAFTCVVSGYDPQQTGNSLYWLNQAASPEAPHTPEVPASAESADRIAEETEEDSSLEKGLRVLRSGLQFGTAQKVVMVCLCIKLWWHLP